MIRSSGEFRRLREEMVEELRSRYGIRDERILTAMTRVRRHVFIPECFRDTTCPYGDHPCPIGYGQTISQPYIVSHMIEQLEIQPGEKVLEIGTGSGYQAAVLAELGADVYSMEILHPLAAYAQRVLNNEGYEHLHLRQGDGYKGWPEQAPFDVILLACAPTAPPPLLLDQLDNYGRMILPVGRGTQQLLILSKRDGTIVHRRDLMVRFVPMIENAE